MRPEDGVPRDGLPEDWRERMVGMIRGASPADGGWFTGGPSLTPQEQIEIYQEQYRLRMWDAIVEDIPGTLRLLGDEGEDVVWRYLADCPPDTWTLSRLAHRFAGWLDAHGFPDAVVDVARLDEAVSRGFLAADGHTPTPGEIEAALGAGTLRLRLQPHVTLVRTRSTAHRFRSAVVTGQDVPEVVPADFRLAVFRSPELTMRHQELEPGAWAILDAFARGGTLDDALGAAVEAEGDAQRLVAKLGGWFRLFVERHLVELDG